MQTINLTLYPLPLHFDTNHYPERENGNSNDTFLIHLHYIYDTFTIHLRYIVITYHSHDTRTLNSWYCSDKKKTDNVQRLREKDIFLGNGARTKHKKPRCVMRCEDTRSYR